MTKTIICDIDGTILHQEKDCWHQITSSAKLTPGALNKIRSWEKNNCNIILITGRKESTRAATEKQLSSLGIMYDHLVMGVGGGPRILINDLKPGKDIKMAVSYNLTRNEGLESVED